MCYHISKRECYSSMWATIDAINGHPEFLIEFPIGDVGKLQQIELDFALAHMRRYGSMSWRGEVGAIDGMDISQRNPGKAVRNPLRFHVDRKDGYELLCIAICDAHRRFTFYDMSHEARSHDSNAWAGTPLGVKINEGALPLPFFLNGDAAFTCTNSMITPTGGATDFDFYQSSNRMAIECAFGMLVRRWGVFWRPLEVKFKRRTALVGAAMRLHNYCIDERIALELRQRSGASEIQPRVWMPTPLFDQEGRPVKFLETFDSTAAAAVSNCAVRDGLKRGLDEAALVRPGETSWAKAKRARAVAAAL